MYAASFDYYRPKNLKQAVQLLRKHKDAKILAGGHSLLPAMKLRVSAPSALNRYWANQRIVRGQGVGEIRPAGCHDDSCDHRFVEGSEKSVSGPCRSSGPNRGYSSTKPRHDWW